MTAVPGRLVVLLMNIGNMANEKWLVINPPRKFHISLRASQKSLWVLQWRWKLYIRGYKLFCFSVWHQFSFIIASLNLWHYAQCPFYHFPHLIHKQFHWFYYSVSLRSVHPYLSFLIVITFFFLIRFIIVSTLNHCNKVTQCTLYIAAKMILQNIYIPSWNYAVEYPLISYCYS